MPAARERTRERRRRRRERAQAKAAARAKEQSHSFWQEVRDRLEGFYWRRNDQRVHMYDLYTQRWDLRYAEAERRARLPLSTTGDRVEDAIRWATIDTAYASFYRYHARAFLRHGTGFPRNWVPWPDKVTRTERFSPPGVVGWYFGLTEDAARGEALHYGHGKLDPESQILLVLECCFSNILYLASPGAVSAVWTKVGLPPMRPYEMLLAIMHPDTANEFTDRIGLWARDRGLSGIIYPTARYTERLHAADWADLHNGTRTFLAAVNHIALHSRLDIMGHSPHMRAAVDYHDRYAYIHGRKIPYESVQDVPADLNLVLFSGDQIDGSREAVFYQAMPVWDAHLARAQETRRTTWQDTHHLEGEAAARTERRIANAIGKQRPERLDVGGGEMYRLRNGLVVFRYGPEDLE